MDASKGENQSKCLPLANSLGLYVPINVKLSTSLGATSTDIRYYYIFQFNYGGVACFRIPYTISTGLFGATVVSEFNDFQSSNPSTLRHSRFTVKVLNTSNGNNIAGSVRAVQVPNGLNWLFANSTSLDITQAFGTSIEEMLSTNSHSKIYTGSDFGGIGKKFSLLPSSYANLSEWQPFQDWDNSGWLTKQAFLQTSAAYSTHGTLILCIDAVASNSYQFQINCQFAARYPANTILSSVGQQPLTSTPKQLQAMYVAANAASTVGDHTEGRVSVGIAWQTEPPKLKDSKGLEKAYKDVNNVYFNDGVLYVSGTHLNKIDDIVADMNIPSQTLSNTKRYEQLEQLIDLYKPNTLVGHSLGGSLVLEFQRRNPYVEVRTYGAPVFTVRGIVTGKLWPTKVLG